MAGYRPSRTLNMNGWYVLPLIIMTGLVCVIAGCTSVPPAAGPGTVTPAQTPNPVSTPVAGTPSGTVLPVASVPVPAVSGPVPSISVDSPGSGAILPSGPIGISVVVRNFSLVDPAGQANAPGTGHIRYFIDIIPPSSGAAVTAPSGNYVDSSRKSYTWNNVNPGVHTFSVELVNNDNSPLATPAIATVQLTVIQGPPLGSGGGGGGGGGGY
jgi:hypothetical protein